jgi:nucleoside-diphosphate-sugar epimerase
MTASPLRILLTGGSGFLGSRLAAHFLRRGHRVKTLLRQSSHLAELDKLGIAQRVEILRLAPDCANIPDLIGEASIDVAVHLAAVGGSGKGQAEVERMVSANILFPSLLLAAMQAKGIRSFVNTGSSWQNTQSGAFRPVNFYAASKQAFEQILSHYVELGVSAVTLRLFDVYGPADPRGKLISLLAGIAASGKTLDMTPGEQKIDLIHVDDVCRAYDCAIAMVVEKPPAHRVFGVSGGNPIGLRDLVELFERVRGAKCNINWGKRPYRDYEIMEPYRGYESPPGWTPQVKLEDGLRNLESLDQ